MKLDLKGWKKIHTESGHSILRNEGGHLLKIQHGPLNPKTRGQLAELPLEPSKNAKKSPQEHFAKGGEIDPTQQHLEPGDKMPNAIEKEVVGQAKGKIGHYAEGTDVPIPGVDSPDQNSSTQPPQEEIPSFPAPIPTSGAQAQGQAYGEAYGASPEAPKTVPIPEDPQGAAYAQAYNAGNAPAKAPEAAPSGSPNLGTSIDKAQSQAAQQPGQDIFGTNAYYGALSKGINEQKAGLAGQAAAESQTAKEQAGYLKEQVAQQQRQQQDYQSHYQSLDAERHAMQQDAIKHDIDPTRYWGSLGTGDKIKTGLGVMLGGLGSAITGQANPAMTYLNHQIERDIDSQKANLGTRKTLLEANLKQFGNLRDATDMTRIMMQDHVKNQMSLAAANSGDQMAKARMLQGMGAIDHDNAQALGQIAMRQTLLSSAKRGEITPSQYIMAVVPEHEKAGVAKEVKEAQDASQFRDNTLSTLDQLYKTNTVGNRILNPIQAPKQIAALKNVTLDKLTKDTSGRVTPETVHLIGSAFDSMLANPETYKVQRNAINNILTSTMHYPLAEQWIPRDTLVKGRYNEQGAPTIPHVPLNRQSGK